MKGKKENDPEWIKDIASYLIANKKQETTDEYTKQLRDFFLEYIRNGLKPKEAFEKAKAVLASFGVQKHKTREK